MLYRAIGLMSGSSLDGLDMVFASFNEQGGKWNFEILNAGCYSYSEEWHHRLKNATALSAKEYLLLHSSYGHYLGEQVMKFIEANQIHYQAALIASHGHTTFHLPALKMTAQLGDGSAIAAITGLPVVTDLRALDVALGGQGAPIVPIGEKLLLNDYDYFLNIGGIANISVNSEDYIAFDVCPANRVLNMLANNEGKEFDEAGKISSTGNVDEQLLAELNQLEYYKAPFPKSLANDFGTDVVYPMIERKGISSADALRTYTEHIAVQISKSLHDFKTNKLQTANSKLLVTGGGAFNIFLIERLKYHLSDLGIQIVVPDEKLVKYKEALIMAFIGVLRWRQEYNVLSSVTGAVKNSIGGALWTGQDA
ncbi:MAG TPA: anhydro-N-acetylmuramic acid kinase [Chitinophagaceae bacterium]|nr:anhydro-N-acetylmuramic acid kinase [Chitinophagaceae bacterium]